MAATGAAVAGAAVAGTGVAAGAQAASTNASAIKSEATIQLRFLIMFSSFLKLVSQIKSLKDFVDLYILEPPPSQRNQIIEFG